MSKKKALREKLRAQRRKLSKVERDKKASAMACQITQLDAWPKCAQIALYFGSDGEISSNHVAETARNCNKELFLPIVKNDGLLEFALWQKEAVFAINRFGIPEPDQYAPRIPAHHLEIICLPLVGWDRSGNRLGMGGGFYDKTLSASMGKSCLVGLAFAMQECEEIPAEPHDVPLDFVVTESEIISTNRRIH